MCGDFAHFCAVAPQYGIRLGMSTAETSRVSNPAANWVQIATFLEILLASRNISFGCVACVNGSACIHPDVLGVGW